MDSVFKNFMTSGKTLITDTLAPKSELVKEKKKKGTLPEPASLDPLENLLKRVVDENVSKLEIIEVFDKIIKIEEAKI
jgi:hypothetical protein